MLRSVVIVCLLTLVGGCIEAPGAPLHSTPAPPISASAPPTAGLLARPVKLPNLQPGSPCPVTPVSNVRAQIGDPRGSGPFYLGGRLPRGGYPWNKMVYELMGGASGRILFRGGRIDGPGRLEFSGSPAGPSDKGETLTGVSVTRTFYERIYGPGPTSGFYVYPSTPGCYALQVDGTEFEDMIIVIAS